MPLSRDRDLIEYNRYEREIRQPQSGKGMPRRQASNLNNRRTGVEFSNVLASACRWVSDNKRLVEMSLTLLKI